MSVQFRSRVAVCKAGYSWASIKSQPVNFMATCRKQPKPGRNPLVLMPGKPGIDPGEEDFSHREYDAFIKEPSLYRDFAKLGDEASIIKFSDRYGELWCNEPGWPTLNEYMAQVLDMRDALELHQAIKSEDNATLEKHVRWRRGKLEFCSPLSQDVDIGDGAKMSTAEVQPLLGNQFTTEQAAERRQKRYKPGDLIAPANDLLDHVFRVHGGVVGDFIPIRLLSGILSFAVLVEPLVRVLWVQFALAIAEDKNHRDCEYCGKSFELSPKLTRNDRLFCSDSCRVQSHRTRKARALELLSLGKTPKQIAKEVVIPVETINKWLKSEEN